MYDDDYEAINGLLLFLRAAAHIFLSKIELRVVDEFALAIMKHLPNDVQPIQTGSSYNREKYV